MYYMNMKILGEKIQKNELLKMEFVLGGPMIKGVVDVKKELLGVDADLHADIEKLFLENGSIQEDLWGINLYPEEDGEDFLEFDSMINIRPRQGNRIRGVEDEQVRKKIAQIVAKWVEK